jgi:hypothetical protein
MGKFLGLQIGEDRVNTIAAPTQTLYNNSSTGAVDARNKGLDRLGANDADSGAMDAGQDAARKAAAEAATRGPQVTQDAGIAGQVANGANGNRAGAIELARQQAMGMAPSQGAYQLQAGLDLGSQQQAAQARGARGSAALATGTANANANVSNLQQNAFTGAGMLRSQDMANGRGMYNTLTGQARDQSGQVLGEANNVGVTNQQMNDNHGLNMGNASVGLGGVSNGFNGEDFGNANEAFGFTTAQDDANQALQEQKFGVRKQADAANERDA